MNDILDAVQIDKNLELFKSGAGGEGGYIRISINFVNDLKDLEKPAGALSLLASALLAASLSSRFVFMVLRGSDVPEESFQRSACVKRNDRI